MYILPMIFSIQRASGKNGKPCAEAVEVLPGDEDTFDPALYIIHFDSLEKLMEFVQREKDIVIYRNGKHRYNCWSKSYERALEAMPDTLIMIYDDYLE